MNRCCKSLAILVREKIGIIHRLTLLMMLLNLLDGIIRLRFPRTDLVLVPNQAVIEFATNLVSRTKFD
jgi:hypothetical protein